MQKGLAETPSPNMEKPFDAGLWIHKQVLTHFWEMSQFYLLPKPAGPVPHQTSSQIGAAVGLLATLLFSLKPLLGVVYTSSKVLGQCRYGRCATQRGSSWDQTAVAAKARLSSRKQTWLPWSPLISFQTGKGILRNNTFLTQFYAKTDLRDADELSS